MTLFLIDDEIWKEPYHYFIHGNYERYENAPL